MTETHHALDRLLARKLSQERRRLGAGKQEFALLDLGFGRIQRFREYFRSLHRANVWTRYQKFWCVDQSCNAFGHFLGASVAFRRQITFRIRRTFRIFAVDGDTVTNNVEQHLFPISSLNAPTLYRRILGQPYTAINLVPVSPLAAENIAGCETPFRKARYCGWRREYPRWRRRALLSANQPRRAEKPHEFY